MNTSFQLRKKPEKNKTEIQHKRKVNIIIYKFLYLNRP